MSSSTNSVSSENQLTAGSISMLLALAYFALVMYNAGRISWVGLGLGVVVISGGVVVSRRTVLGQHTIERLHNRGTDWETGGAILIASIIVVAALLTMTDVLTVSHVHLAGFAFGAFATLGGISLMSGDEPPVSPA
jgi:hypothetical protein